MSLDDELRRRLQQAADHAGAGTDPAALAQQASTTAAAGARPPLRLLGALGAVGLVAGGALGYTALQPQDAAGAAPAVRIEVQQYSLYDCPDGAPVGIAYPGDRVYVVGRDDSGDWLAVRDPRNHTIGRWVPAAAVDPDAVADVPVMTCTETVELVPGDGTTTTDSTTTSSTVPESTTTTSTVVATTVPATVPPTAPPTAPPTVPPTLPPDTQQPTVGQQFASTSPIYDSSWSANCASTSTITVIALDNVAVTQVRGAYADGLPGSPLVFTKQAGNTWTATFGPFGALGPLYAELVDISITARDAAGNTSTPVVVSVQVYGTCLI